MVTKMYHSRETRISDLHGEDERCNYESVEADTKKITEAFDTFGEYFDGLEDKMEEYLDAIAETDEDAHHHIKHQRRELIESWALAQAALSKFAWVLRVDGNEAYQRMITAIKDGKEVNMEGL